MSTSIKVVGHLSLVGLMMALLGCGGASQEQEVTSGVDRRATQLRHWPAHGSANVC